MDTQERFLSKWTSSAINRLVDTLPEPSLYYFKCSAHFLAATGNFLETFGAGSGYVETVWSCSALIRDTCANLYISFIAGTAASKMSMGSCTQPRHVDTICTCRYWYTRCERPVFSASGAWQTICIILFYTGHYLGYSYTYRHTFKPSSNVNPILNPPCQRTQDHHIQHCCF